MLVAKFIALTGMLEKLPNDMVSMCVNKKLLDRPSDEEVFKALPEVFQKGGYKRSTDKPRPQRKPARVEPVTTNAWERAKQDEKEVEMIEIAKKAIIEARKKKDNSQEIRLCLNLIAPNNFAKKLAELRVMLIGDAKLMNEPGYNAEESAGFEIDSAKLDIVV